MTHVYLHCIGNVISGHADIIHYGTVSLFIVPIANYQFY